MRAFLAVPVPDAVKAAAARLQEELRRAGADVSWSRPEQMHLTLKFFAEIGEAGAGRFGERLTASLPRGPVELEFAGLGRFPKVVWAGVTGGLAPLAACAEAAAEAVGVPRETRPFSPHLTLGRIRSPRNLPALEAAMGARADVVLGRGSASELILYESTLAPGGAVHEARRVFPL